MSAISADQWQLLSACLDEVLQLPAEERASRLTLLAQQQPELAALLSDYLAASDQHEFHKFLAGAGPRIAEELTSATLVGRQVGPYIIDAEIGRGGTGSVWRAHRADGRFDGTVAIKFVHAVWIGRSGEHRFRVEGKLLAQLDHPNIARLIDAGVLDATQPYLVLEYVEGEPIDAYCGRCQLAVEARVKLFLEVLAAVAHAHSHLIVHRDIKPSNIFVTGEGRVKLLDFGIAKLLASGVADQALTQSGVAALTPLYAAPEQMLGQAVTTATDVYSLGLVLFVLLTGTHPISVENLSAAALVHAVLTEIPPHASVVSSIAAVPAHALQGDLDNIVAKALKKTPAERYPTVESFADDLSRFLNDEPVQARRDTFLYRSGKFVRRHRTGVAAGLLVTLGLVGVSAFALWQMFEARTQRDIAVSQARLAGSESELTEFLIGDSLKQASEGAARERLERAREFVTHRFAKDPSLAAQLLLVLASRYVSLGDDRTAAQVTSDAEAIARRLDHPALLGQLACMRSQFQSVAHDYVAARAQLDSGLAQVRRAPFIPSQVIVECARASAKIAQSVGDFASAAANLRVAVQNLEQTGAYGSTDFVSAVNDLALALMKSGNFHDAWDAESRIIALERESGLAETSDYFALVNVGSTALRFGGRPRQARDLIDSAMADARQDSLNVEIPAYLEASRAMAQLVMGPSESASDTLKRAAEAARQAGVQYWPLFQVALVTDALDRGDAAKADSLWEPLAAVENKMLAGDERGDDLVRLRLIHARLEMAHDRLESSGAIFDDAASRIAARRQPLNPDATSLELLRTQLLFSQHAYAQAITHADAAAQLARATAVEAQASAWVGEALVWRARSCQAAGRAAEAAAAAEAALPHLLANLDDDHPLIAWSRALSSGH